MTSRARGTGDVLEGTARDRGASSRQSPAGHLQTDCGTPAKPTRFYDAVHLHNAPKEHWHTRRGHVRESTVALSMFCRGWAAISNVTPDVLNAPCHALLCGLGQTLQSQKTDALAQTLQRARLHA